MSDRFVTRKELNRLMKNQEQKFTGISVRESIKAPSPEQAQSEEFPDEVYAGRNERDADFTETNQSRWATFVTKLLPKMNWNMRVFVGITVSWEVDFACVIGIRLRNGASGYDAAGTTRGIIEEQGVSGNQRASTVLALFDIPAGSITDAARICCDIKSSNNNGVITVYGDTALGGNDVGGCEIRIFSVSRY